MLAFIQRKYEFTSEDFYKGTGQTCAESNTELLWKIFCQWKQDIKISEEDRIRWMSQIEQLISQRTDGIMVANRRNYYDECAAFIAALKAYGYKK